MEQVSEFKYLRFVFGYLSIYSAKCRVKATIRRKVVGAIRSLVNVRSLRLEWGRVLHKASLMAVLLNVVEITV